MTHEDSDSVTVLFADSDPLARQSMELMLSDSDIRILGTCGSVSECLAQVESQPPQVVVVDIHLGSRPRAGLDLVRKIRQISPTTSCMVLTGTDISRRFLPDAILAGAHSYHAKGYVAGEQLPNMIKRLAAGEVEIDQQVAAQMVRYLGDDPATSEQSAPPGRYPLTSHESDLLRRVAAGSDVHNIARDLRISASAVKSHLRNITDKVHRMTVQPSDSA